MLNFSVQINLTTSPAAAQMISRQSISSTPTSISQQAVLVGSPSSSTLTANQAHMYLRAQMVRCRHSHIYMSMHICIHTTTHKLPE